MRAVGVHMFDRIAVVLECGLTNDAHDDVCSR